MTSSPHGRIAVYSCLTNGYDRPLPPIDPVPGVDYILFTDRPEAPARGWQARPLAMAGDLSPALANRYHKLLPHKVLPNHAASIYLDSNIQVISSLAPLIEDVFGTGEEDLAVYVHPSRRTVQQEMESCLAAGRVRDPQALRDEVSAYRAEGFPDAGTLTGNSILMRRHLRPEVIAAMETWWQLVSEHSGRDQISLPYLRWKLGLRVRELTPHFSQASPYFRRYPHWSKAGPRAKALIWLAGQADQPGTVGRAARGLHQAVGGDYRT